MLVCTKILRQFPNPFLSHKSYNAHARIGFIIAIAWWLIIASPARELDSNP
jgi:hypothetical protein